MFTCVGMTHRFSQCCAQNIAIENNGCTATRTRHFNYGVVFSADPLKSNELFEVNGIFQYTEFLKCIFMSIVSFI